MKTRIVGHSIVRLESSLDPEHYLGRENAILDKLDRLQEEIFRKGQKIRLLEKAVEDDRARVARLAVKGKA